MKRISIYRFPVAAAAMLALALASVASAQSDELSVTYRFGSLGLTRGYAARLVVSNTGYPPDPCIVELRFYPPQPIAPPDPVVPPDPVRPGQQVIAELRGDDLIRFDAPKGTRLEVAAR